MATPVYPQGCAFCHHAYHYELLCATLTEMNGVMCNCRGRGVSGVVEVAVEDEKVAGPHPEPADVRDFVKDAMANGPIGPRVVWTTTEKIKEKSTKPRYSLLPWEALARVVAVFEFGAVKHSVHGWKTVPDAIQIYKDAAARHLAAMMRGEWYDSETHESHAAHLACCALIIVWHQTYGE